MDVVDVTVYYLEMQKHDNAPAPLTRDGLTVLHAQRPSVAYYRFLYDAVGRDYHWLSRRTMSDDELAAVLQSPGSEVHVLHVDGSPAGFAELDFQSDDVELVQFGLMQDFIGQGLGKWFLGQMIDRVWRTSPERFWLHTCTLDHPTALSFYKSMGFLQYREEHIQREL